MRVGSHVTKFSVACKDSRSLSLKAEVDPILMSKSLCICSDRNFVFLTTKAARGVYGKLRILQGFF